MSGQQFSRKWFAATLALAVGVVAGPVSQAGASTQQPVDTNSTPDPGVTLFNGEFYAFTTGGFGLSESTAPTASGPWTAPTNTMDKSSVPAWIDQSAGIWAPDMVRIPTSGEFVVYFAAELNAAASTIPPGARVRQATFT